jgi:microcystin-dependent protein
MPTPTTNYSFNIPTVGADDELWGGFLNTNWTALDTLLFSGTVGAATTGNAATATAFQTARTINGVSFDGTANITIPTVPAGGIIMWSGSVASIPSGWFLCDGANGTPDLRNRFVVGAGSTYNPGDTGGADSVTLSASQIPGHTHSFSATTSTASLTGSAGPIAETFGFNGTTTGVFSKTAQFGNNTPSSVDGSESGRLNIDASHNHTLSGTTGSTGGGGSHENRPPYYALAYIMKA